MGYSSCQQAPSLHVVKQQQAKLLSLGPLSKSPDHVLLELFISGDHGALTVLYDRYFEKISQWITGLHPEWRERAEDLAQDIFLQICERPQKMRSVRTFDNYLFFMVRNRLINERIKKSTHQKAICLFNGRTEWSVDDVEQQLLYKETEKIYYDSIEQLPARAKEAYRLKNIQGSNHQRIAEQMGICHSVVKQHLNKANKRIRCKMISHIDQYSKTK